MARADRRRAARAAGARRAEGKAGRRPSVRVASESAYRRLRAPSRATVNKVRDVARDWDQAKAEGREVSISDLARRHHTTRHSIEKYLPTRRSGRRVELAPPGERRLYGGPIPALVNIDGRPTVVNITPRNDAQRNLIQRNSRGAFAAVTRDEDADLRATGGRTVTDAETGEKYRLWGEGDALRSAAEDGEVDLSDLRYQGGHRSNIDALLEGEAAA